MTSAITRELTLLVPALNEEGKITQTIEEIVPVGRELLQRFEIIVVNDGSTDGTGAEMDALAAAHPEVRVIHNAVNQGLGWSFQTALAQAQYASFSLIPGDGAYAIEGLRAMFRAIGAADLIVGYRTNQFRSRSTSRVVLSVLYKRIVSVAFGGNLLDYHCGVVFPTAELRALDLECRGYTFQLEALIKLLGQGTSFVQVPMTLNREEAGSRSLRAKTFLDVARTMWQLRAERGR